MRRSISQHSICLGNSVQKHPLWQRLHRLPHKGRNPARSRGACPQARGGTRTSANPRTGARHQNATCGPHENQQGVTGSHPRPHKSFPHRHQPRQGGGSPRKENRIALRSRLICHLLFTAPRAPKAGTVLRNGPLRSGSSAIHPTDLWGQRSLPMKMSLRQLLLFLCLPSPSLPSS